MINLDYYGVRISLTMLSMQITCYVIIDLTQNCPYIYVIYKSGHFNYHYNCFCHYSMPKEYASKNYL